MTNELDNFLNSMKDEQKKKKLEQQKLWGGQNAFIKEFKKALEEIIHPAMLDICSKLRAKDCYALALKRRREKSNPLTLIDAFAEPPKVDAKAQFAYKHYENYYVSGGEIASGFGFIITVLGNFLTQKVCVFTQFVKHQGNSPSASVKVSEEQFQLENMSSQLFDTLIATAMKELLAIKLQSDDNKTSS